MGPGGPLPTRALDLGHRQSRSGGEPNKPRVRINLMAGAKMIDVPARRSPRRAQPGGGHRVPISPPARKENHEEMKRTGAQSWCFLWGKLVFCGRDGERDDREVRSRQNMRVERDESRRKAKPLELERQARCKRRATAASRRSARAHLPGRAPRAAEKRQKPFIR